MHRVVYLGAQFNGRTGGVHPIVVDIAHDRFGNSILPLVELPRPQIRMPTLCITIRCFAEFADPPAITTSQGEFQEGMGTQLKLKHDSCLTSKA